MSEHAAAPGKRRAPELMPADLDPGARCDHEVGCITCGDEAVAMRVAEVDEASALAVCRDPGGSAVTVDVGLLDAIAAGESILVHAGVALQRVEPEEALA